MKLIESMILNWDLQTFDDLTTLRLYRILQLRSEVFIVEQKCVYMDIDGKDMRCHHLSGWTGDARLAAYTRIVPPGLNFEEVSIGRVITSSSVRAAGIGKLLMNKSIESVYELYGNVPIRIGAQLYLRRFYESLGFVQSSKVYFEDNIEHIEMLREAGL